MQTTAATSACTQNDSNGLFKIWPHVSNHLTTFLLIALDGADRAVPPTRAHSSGVAWGQAPPDVQNSILALVDATVAEKSITRCKYDWFSFFQKNCIRLQNVSNAKLRPFSVNMITIFRFCFEKSPKNRQYGVNMIISSHVRFEKSHSCRTWPQLKNRQYGVNMIVFFVVVSENHIHVNNLSDAKNR